MGTIYGFFSLATVSFLPDEGVTSGLQATPVLPGDGACTEPHKAACSGSAMMPGL